MPVHVSVHKQSADLRYTEDRKCAQCGCSGAFQFFFDYTVYLAYGVFGCRGRGHYFCVCGKCRDRQKVPKHEIPAMFRFDPAQVPFMHRFGLLVFLAFMLLILVVAVAYDPK